MATETNTTPFLDIVTDVDEINAAVPQKGAVVSLVPKSDAIARQMMRSGHELPVGIYQDCTAFDMNDTGNAAEKRRRFGLPLATTAAALLSEHVPHSLAVRLMEMNVRGKYHTAAMIEAARQYFMESSKGTLTPQRADWLKEQLNKAQDELYPQLDTKIADYALAMTKGETVANRLLSTEAREQWSEYLHKKLDPVFATVYEQSADGAINGMQLRDMTELFAQSTGLPIGEGNDAWSIVYDESVSSFSVNPASKTVRVGLRHVALTQLQFEKLMIHEIMIHAWRAENGSRTGYPAFQSGLPGYVESEEGTGILMESLWAREDPEQLSRDHFRYAVVSYASGVYDDTLHTEQETFEFAKQLMDDAQVKDEDELARHVMRVYRGMPEGCRMRSNATYLAGKIGMMRHLETAYREGASVDAVFRFLQAGKIDIDNPEQVTLLREALAEGGMIDREEAIHE